MAVLPATLVSLLLTTAALGAPTRNVRSTVEKRGFRAAVRHYIPKNVVARDTGETSASFNGGGWLIEVQIGGEQLTLNVDTGSSDLWTASTLLSADEQSLVSTGQFYDPTQSSSWQGYLNGSTFSIAYGDNSSASGPVGIDTVNIGGASVQMPFGLAQDLKLGDGATGPRDSDGPVGLGFRASNSITSGDVPNRQCTFMECLEPYVPDPIFSTHFATDDSGFIDFGYYDQSAYTGDISAIQLTNTSSAVPGQWAAQGVTFGSGGTVFSSGPLDMMFDTGSAGLNIPSDAASDYFSGINGVSTNSQGFSTYPCSAQLPDLDYIFAEATATIPGSNIQKDGGDGTTCTSWIQVSDAGHANAGVPFYTSKYVIWNQETLQMSFADQA